MDINVFNEKRQRLVAEGKAPFEALKRGAQVADLYFLANALGEQLAEEKIHRQVAEEATAAALEEIEMLNMKIGDLEAALRGASDSPVIGPLPVDIRSNGNADSGGLADTAAEAFVAAGFKKEYGA